MRKNASLELTQETLKSLLNYDPNTGIFHWKVRRHSVAPGSVAGSSDDKGYVRIWVCQRAYKAHRLAWLYVNGMWPDGQIDHANGSRADNRISNLRVCTNADNGQNRGVNSNNRSGAPGVSFHSKVGKWQAHIGIRGVRHALGSFSSKEDAAAAYVEAKAQLHQFNPSIRLA